MRIFYLFFLIAFLPAIAIGQNLVPNGNLEDTLFCPFTVSQPYAANHWLNFGQSPEYFNACANSSLNVPFTAFGYQFAHSGVGMVGLIAYNNPSLAPGQNYREYIGVQLDSTLKIGVQYFLSFYVNFGNANTSTVPCNNLGLKLSTVPYDSVSHPPTDNFAHLNYPFIISDSLSWIKVSGSFIADSSYQFLALGNFFDDAHTDTLHQSNFVGHAYYFFDDICLTRDSIFNETWTGINNISETNLACKIWPNPASDFINVSSYKKIKSIHLYDSMGNLIVQNNSSSANTLNISNCTEGIYLIKVEFDNSLFETHIVIILQTF